MAKPSFKLVGAPCGQQGQYTFYKALRIISDRQEKIIAIGDFFFVRIWQDSELVSIGELQLLWTDRVSDQTLVSLRLYFLPENTPDGRSQHGEDEVLVLNEKVVLRADDLLSWISDGAGWRCGLRAVWRGACAPAPAAPAPPAATTPLQQTKLDFSDVDREKNDLVPDPESPGVVVFSYPRYCRYRALVARLEGMQAAWLRHSLVAALGGYAADTNNTTILYCKDTFEYPELEGHEFVCNHLAPRLKGRPRGRRRRAQRSRSHTPSSRSSDGEPAPPPRADLKVSPRRLSLRNGALGGGVRGDGDGDGAGGGAAPRNPADLRLLQPRARTPAHRQLSLRALYESVSSKGGFEAVCRKKLWAEVNPLRPTKARDLYIRYLRPYEAHEKSNGRRLNGKFDCETGVAPPKDTLDICLVAPASTAEDLNREFLEAICKEERAPPPEPDNQKPSVVKLFEENSGLVAELSAKYNVTQSKILEEAAARRLSAAGCAVLAELARRLHPAQTVDWSLLRELTTDDQITAAPSQPAIVNGHTPEQRSRPAGRSSLRAVRVKPARPPAHAPATASAAANTPTPRPEGISPPAPPVTNFGIHRPPAPAPAPAPAAAHSDDEIVEVPYKPKTPEIIDLDEYPESPQASKKKKLDILKERGLEVTPLPPAWGVPGPPTPLLLNPAMQHQIMTQASLFQMYNIIPPSYSNGIQPPKVIQSSCVYGSTTPEKTVYGNPKDPFMPPPHILHGTPVKPQRAVSTERVECAPTRQGILDLTCKTSSAHKPTVEIVRIPQAPSPSKSVAKNYTLLDGKAVVGSNLEITLVNPVTQTPPKNKQPQKRSSNGKFMSAKTPTPPRDYSKDYAKNYPSPSGVKHSPPVKKPSNPINIPTYQVSKDDISPTSSTGSKDSQQNAPPTNLLQNVFKNQNSLVQMMEMQKGAMGHGLNQNLGSVGQNLPQIGDLQKSVPLTPFVDPMYMSAFYSSLAGQMDQRQLAMYRELMANQFRYSGLLGGVATPTTKN